MDLKDIDKLFREQQHSGDEMPREEVWFRLEEKVDKMRPVSEKRTYAKLVPYMAAASIGALFLIGAYFLNDSFNKASSADYAALENSSKSSPSSPATLKRSMKAESITDSDSVNDSSFKYNNGSISGDASEAFISEAVETTESAEEEKNLIVDDGFSVSEDLAMNSEDSDTYKSIAEDVSSISYESSEDDEIIAFNKPSAYPIPAPSEVMSRPIIKSEAAKESSSIESSSKPMAPPPPLAAPSKEIIADMAEIEEVEEIIEQGYSATTTKTSSTAAGSKSTGKRSTSGALLDKIITEESMDSDVSIESEMEELSDENIEAIEDIVISKQALESKDMLSPSSSVTVRESAIPMNSRTPRYEAEGEDFSWMEGRWSNQSASTHNLIRIAPESGGDITAQNFNIENNDTILFEELRFRSDANGTKVLKKRAETDSDYTHYLLVKSEDDRWIFIDDNGTQLILEKRRNSLYYHYQTTSGQKISSPKKFKKVN